MVTNALTDQSIDQGRQLIEKLDASGVRAKGALWLYSPEQDAWKLALSFRAIDKRGPRFYYTKIQNALSKLDHDGGLTLNDVTLLKPNAELIRLLASAIHTSSGIEGIRFSNNAINGQLIPDSYIYRLSN